LARNLFEYHPILGYRFIPGIEARVSHEGGGYTVRASSSGFNCVHEVTREKSPDTFRIVLFGDSYTAGDGVSIGYRYGDLLEAGLGRAQVLNFGLPGSGTDQQYLAFREFAAGIDYDLMIISPMVENIRRILRPFSLTIQGTDGQVVRRPKPYFELTDGRLELRQVPVPREVIPVATESIGELLGEKPPGRLKRLLHSLFRKYPDLHLFLTRVRRLKFPPEYESPHDPGWLLMKGILTTWIRQSKTPVILCPIPTFAHIDKGYSPQGYLRRFAELDADVVDLLPEFWKLNAVERRRCRFPIDDHPTRFGHEVIARGLSPHVRRYYQSWEQRLHAVQR
jgi:carbamoyltransferase